jgi:hypothetical protein
MKKDVRRNESLGAISDYRRGFVNSRVGGGSRGFVSHCLFNRED